MLQSSGIRDCAKGSNRMRLSAISCCLMLSLILCSCVGHGSVSASHPDGFQSAKVVRVVDGDTLIVSIDGAESYCRELQIDAPESKHPDASLNTDEGAAASEFVSSVLKKGDTVYLQSGAEDVDNYGRLLRYVWLEIPSDPADSGEASSKMLNAITVREGYAEAHAYTWDATYSPMFRDLQDEAVRNGKGVSYLWARD